MSPFIFPIMWFLVLFCVLFGFSEALKFPVKRISAPSKNLKDIRGSQKYTLDLWEEDFNIIVDIDVGSSAIQAYVSFVSSDLLVIPENVTCMGLDFYDEYYIETDDYMCQDWGAIDPDDLTIYPELPSRSILFNDTVITDLYYAKADIKISSFDNDVITVDNFTLAVLNISRYTANTLGIGLPAGQRSNMEDYDVDDYFEVTSSVDILSDVGKHSSDGKTYDGLITRLKKDDKIDKEQVALYWSDSDYGTILIGEEDDDVYVGDLKSIPLINTVKSWGYDDPIFFAVKAKSFEYEGESEDIDLDCYIFPTVEAFYAPESIFNLINETVDGISEGQSGYIAYECDNNISDVYFTLGFSDDANVTIAIEDFKHDGSEQGICYLDVIKSSGALGIGYPILKNYYMSFDYEDMTFSFAVNKDKRDNVDDSDMDASESDFESTTMSEESESTSRSEASESTSESEESESTNESAEPSDLTDEDDENNPGNISTDSSTGSSAESSSSSEFGDRITPDFFSVLLFTLFCLVL